MAAAPAASPMMLNSRSSSPSNFSTLPYQTSTHDAPSPAGSESSDAGYGPVDINSMDEIKDTKKRRRTSPQELATLESNFQQNPLPDLQLRQSIAKKLNMTPRAVQIWFQVGLIRMSERDTHAACM